jgi:hypothetical protein
MSFAGDHSPRDQSKRRVPSTTTARSISRSRLRTYANEKVRRVQSHPSEIQHLSDLRPVLLECLREKDLFFNPLESVTGLDREQVKIIIFRFNKIM